MPQQPLLVLRDLVDLARTGARRQRRDRLVGDRRVENAIASNTAGLSVMSCAKNRGSAFVLRRQVPASSFSGSSPRSRATTAPAVDSVSSDSW